MAMTQTEFNRALKLDELRQRSRLDAQRSKLRRWIWAEVLFFASLLLATFVF